jgi:hypothetical protein
MRWREWEHGHSWDVLLNPPARQIKYVVCSPITLLQCVANLLFATQHQILHAFRDPELHHCLRCDLDLLARLWIAANACFALLLHEFADARECELAVLLHFTQSDIGDHIQEEGGSHAVGFGFLGNFKEQGGFGQGFCGHMGCLADRVVGSS